MKIFNWVHKTFQHSLLKEGFAQNGTKKSEITTSNNEVDKQALLKQVDFDMETLHGWRDGILTIGTFGFESMKPSNEPKEYIMLESEEDDEDIEEDEEKSLINEDDNDNNNIMDYLENEELNPLMFTTFGHKSKEVVSDDEPNIESKCSGIEEAGDQRRITLADLFMADGGDVVVVEEHKVIQNKTKSSLSFAKKLIPRVKEDSHPIKNFQRMMRRMLKRKIHPEIEEKVNGESVDQNGTNQIGLMVTNNGGFHTFQSLSLLPTQDAIA